MESTDKHLEIIKNFYGSKVAQRSQIPLINHITEGLRILNWLQASYAVKSAWCLHPIVQSTEDMFKELDNNNLRNADSSAIILAMEYRHVANSYLSNVVNNSDLRYERIKYLNVTLNSVYKDTVKLMLIADKVQNYKDFSEQPRHLYPNYDQLHVYFTDWIYDILELTVDEYKQYKLVAVF